MAFGMIKKIQEDSVDEYSGVLWDLETWKEFTFSKQAGLGEVNRLDMVSYTVVGGEATSLKLEAMVRVTNWNTQPTDMQDAVKAMLRKVATAPSGIDVVIKKI